MDIGSAFTFVFDDEEWIKKLAIGGVVVFLSIFIVPILLLFGYMIEVLRNVRDSQARPLPQWTDIGGLFKIGLPVFGIYFIYSIPSLLLTCATSASNIFMQTDIDPEAAGAIVGLVICLYCFQALVGLLTQTILPAAWIRYAQFGTFGSAFQFGEIFSFIRANIGDYIIVILISWVAGFIASFGFVLCIIGIFFTIFWSTLVGANLYGQLARKAQLSV